MIEQAVKIRQKTATPHLLLIIGYIPNPQLGGGNRRDAAFIQMCVALGWRVSVWVHQSSSNQSNLERFKEMGAAILPSDGTPSSLEVSLANTPFSACLITRWTHIASLLHLMRKYQLRLILDVKDIEFIRELRRIGIEGNNTLPSDHANAHQKEWNAFLSVDAVLCVSPTEQAFLRSALPSRVSCHWLPDAVASLESVLPFEARCGMIFVGNYSYLPNLDAITYLVETVLPLLAMPLREAHPLNIVGFDLPVTKAMAWAKLPYVNVYGGVDDVITLVANARVASVPIRYGTGVKNKVIGAMACGTPVVTTPIGAEGLEPSLMSIAETPQHISQALENLLTNETDWHRLSQAGKAYIETYHREASVLQRYAGILTHFA